MAKIKYIIMEVTDGEATEILPIVFPCNLMHKEMYRAAKNSYIGTIKRGHFSCASAGFLTIDNSIPLSIEAINVFDRSESLNLDSRPEDAKLIYNMLMHDKQVIYENKGKDMLLNKKDINKLMSKF